MKNTLLLIAILFSTISFGQRTMIPSLNGNSITQQKAGVTTQDVSWTTNSVSASYSPSYVNNTGGDLTWSTSGAVTITTTPTTPIISNFRITDANLDRVLFDSDQAITIANTVGIGIYGKTLSGVFVNGTSTTGHYFTVSVPFTYIDNNTIRNDGGGSNNIAEFTMEYIHNQISIPMTGLTGPVKTIYVDVAATGANNGTSQTDAYTSFQSAITNMTIGGGNLIWVKAGTYSEGEITPGTNGTLTEPNVIKGYKVTPGDLDGQVPSDIYTVNLLALYDALDPAEMPLFVGTLPESQEFYNWKSDDNYRFENLQVTNYYRGFHTNADGSSNFQFKNIIIKDNGGTSNQGTGFSVSGSTVTYLNDAVGMRFEDCLAIDMSGNGFSLRGNNALIKNCKVYARLDEGFNSANRVTDYYYNIKGSYNIVTNCLAYKDTDNGNGHSGHGFAVRSESTINTTYNLFVDSEAVGILGSVEFRNENTSFNVAKRMLLRADIANFRNSEYGTAGIAIQGGADNNIAEEIIGHDLSHAFYFSWNSEDTAGADANDNIIRNSVFYNLRRNIIWKDPYSGSVLAGATNNIVENVTFDNSPYFSNIDPDGTASYSGNVFRDCIFTNIPTQENPDATNEGLTGWSFETSNTYDIWVANGTPLAGTGNLSLDPLYDINFYSANPSLDGIGKQNPVVASSLILSGNNLPTFDLSTSGGGTTTITASSETAFIGLKNLYLDNIEVASFNVDNATDLDRLSVKQTPYLSTVDISKLINLRDVTFRTNPLLTSLDISTNVEMDSMWIYSNALTTLDITNNPDLRYIYIQSNSLTDAALDTLLFNLDAPINGPPLSNGTFRYSTQTGGGAPTSDSYDAYNSLINKGWNLIGDVPSTPTPDAPSTSLAGLPVISNFHVKDGEGTKVYFNTNETITASNATGFTISGQTISSIFINGATESGHYFVISPGLTFWDNNTIRYEGGSNIVDSDTNALPDFTLSYIRNDFTEPATSTNRYVTISGSALNGGTSESDAWTIEHAFANQAPGMTIWVKAGNYGQTNYTFTSGGTAINPIRYIGYKSSTNPTVRDISGNYWVYPAAIDTTEMPTFTGDGTSTIQNGRGIYLNGATYITFESIQMDNYVYGVENFGTGNSFIHFKNFNIFDSANSAWNAQDVISGNNNYRYINCQAYNYDIHGISIKGDGNTLLDGNKMYNDDILARKPDYQITFNGDNNIAKNNYMEIFGNEYSASTHGIGVRGGDRLSNLYNLIDSNVAVNINEGFYVRNVGCDYNVIKNNHARNNGSTATYRGGIYIWGGSDFNIVENNLIEDQITAIGFKDNLEENILIATTGEDYEIGRNNIIRNNIIKNVTRGIGINEQTVGGNGIVYDNNIYNNTFYNVTTLVYYESANVDVQNLTFKNNIFNNVTNLSGGSTPAVSPTLVFDYNNFNSGFAATGTNTNIEDPLLSVTYEPQTSALNTGIPVIDIEYDYNKKERDNTNPTLGAVESSVITSTAISPVLSNFRVSDSILVPGQGSSLARVYFNSSESITSATEAFNGFIISGKVITNLFINGASTENHFFTVSSAFDWWDNSTIRYEGNNSLGWTTGKTGSDIIDVDSNSVHDFTLTYIYNYIDEPIATSFKYVTATATGGGTGAIGSPYTFLEGIQNSAAGQKIWVKAGDYGDIYDSGVGEGKISGRDGTSTAPRWIEGYKTSPGDIDNTFISGFTYSGTQAQAATDCFDSTEFPNITGANGAGSYGLYFRSSDYWIIKNIAITGMEKGVLMGPGSGTPSSNHIHFDNVIVGRNRGALATNLGEGIVGSQGATDNIRVINSLLLDNQSGGIKMYGNGGLAMNNKIYCGTATADTEYLTDYYVTTWGASNTIIKDNIAKRLIGVVGNNYSGHSVGSKGDAGNSYILFDNNYAENIGENLFAAYTTCFGIVFKNNSVLNINVTGANGMVARDGVYESVWENNYVENCDAFYVYKSAENYPPDVPSTEFAGKDLLFRNNIVQGGSYGITTLNKEAIPNPGVPVPHKIENVDFYNNTFYNFTNELFYFNITNDNDQITYINCNFKNNIVHTVVGDYNSGSVFGDYLQEYNNYYNCSFTTPAGTGNVDINPAFVSVVEGGFVPTATMTGVTLTEIKYDKAKVERPNPPTIGAREFVTGTTAILSNFRIEDANKDRIYFDSSADITGLTTVGFIVSSNTISSIFINGTSLTGHYITVGTAFTFWDNNTIRLESGDGTVYDFTLTYIENNIVEPVATLERFVTATASGGDGTVGSPWTMVEAWTYVNDVLADGVGIKVWVEAGNYGDIDMEPLVGNGISTDGSATSPITFEGYTTRTGDVPNPITSVIAENFTYGTYAAAKAQVDGSVYPAIIGTGRDARGWWLKNAEYWVIKNIQIISLSEPFFFQADGSNIINYIHIDNCLAGDTYNSANVYTNGFDVFATSTKVRIKRSVVFDSTGNNFHINGDNNLTLNNVSYSGAMPTNETDYHFPINEGSNSIFKGNKMYRVTDLPKGEHAMGAKSSSGVISYVLFDDNYAENISESFFLAYQDTHDNVMKNNEANGTTTKAITGMVNRDGAYNNIWEGNYIHGNVASGFIQWRSTEEPDQTSDFVAYGSIVRNNIIDGASDAIGVSGSWNLHLYSTYKINNTKIYNNTFYNIGGNIFRQSGSVEFTFTYSGNEFYNNIVVGDGVTDLYNSGAAFGDYEQLYNSYFDLTTATPSGMGNVSIDPNFVSVVKGGYVPQATLIGTPIVGVEYDFIGIERASPPTIGAKEKL